PPFGQAVPQRMWLLTGSAAASAAPVGASRTGKGRETSGCRVDCNRCQHVFGEGAEHDTRGRVCSPYHSNAKHIPPPAGDRDGVGRSSWIASFRSCACIGTRNPPLTPPRRGTLAA